MENVTVIDRKPVGGDETAIQSYLDLSLDKNDIVDAVMTGATAHLEDERVRIQKEIDLIEDEKTRLRAESKDWIKKRAVAVWGTKIEALKKLFDTQGSWIYTTNSHLLNGCYGVAEFSIKQPGVDASIEYKILNADDSQHSLAIDSLREALRPLERRMASIDKEIERTMTGRKTVRLQMATAILKRTEQGRQLLESMTIEKLANANNRQLADKGEAKVTAKVGKRR